MTFLDDKHFEIRPKCRWGIVNDNSVVKGPLGSLAAYAASLSGSNRSYSLLTTA